MIRGGYILQPRKFCDSSVAKMPPATREVWLYLLRKVNYCDNPRSGLKRGTGFFTYQQIMDDLCWYAGYRKITYTKNDIAKSLRRLRESSTIDTTKETRGVIVTVCNYEFYQEPKNYEGHTESITKAPRKVRSASTIQEEGYKNKKKEKKESVSVPLKDGSFFSPDLEEYELWVKTYSCNVDEELGKLVVWNINNPKKRKTAKGVKRHICSWLDGAKSNTKGDRYAGIDFSKKH